ncbi:MAG: metal-dependent hydrolase [Desulfurococcales archaeon]|nr:metal-dependent hydrolase [Desulfurococcales archaeon]
MVGYIKFYGHSAFELWISNRKILIDPWLSHPLKVADPSEIKNVDYVLITHGHFDHIGDAITILKNNPNAKVVAVYETADHVAKQVGDAGRAIGANIGGPVRLEDNLKVAFVPANHSSPVGAPTGVVVIGDEATVYHAGDTGITSEMELIGKIYKPDIALLPIGGHFTMDPVEAAYAVAMIKPKVVIPMHYGTFPVLYGTPEEFKQELQKLGIDVEVVILKPGDTYTLQ